MKEQIIELRKKGLTINDIVKQLGCAKSTVSYHINNHGLGYETKFSEKMIEEMNIYYLTHTVEETSNFFKISTSSVKKYCKNKRVLSTKIGRKARVAEAVQTRRKKIKKLAIDYKGGSCQRCGYNKCDGALEFHHLDPTKKDFSISSSGNTRAWEVIKKELDKCIMVCANCHREIHEEERNKKAE
jgi:predicted transcriptional regulator